VGRKNRSARRPTPCPRISCGRPYAPPRDCGDFNQICYVHLMSSEIVPSSFRWVMQKGDSGIALNEWPAPPSGERLGCGPKGAGHHGPYLEKAAA
jgi:hypothetical protein